LENWNLESSQLWILDAEEQCISCKYKMIDTLQQLCAPIIFLKQKSISVDCLLL